MSTSNSLNILNKIPFLRNFTGNDEQLYEHFGPQQAAKLWGEHKGSVRLDFDVGADKGVDDFLASRMTNIDHFTSLKTPDGELLSKKMSLQSLSPEEVESLKTLPANDPQRADLQQKSDKIDQHNTLIDDFNKIFALDNQKVEKPLIDFQQDAKNLNTLLHQDSPRLDIVAAAKKLNDMLAPAKQALNDHQKNVNTAFDEFFKKDENRQRLKDQLVVNDAQLEHVRKEMRAQLDKAQEEELKKFEKTLTDEANKLFIRAKQEYDLKPFLAALFALNQANQENITQAGKGKQKAKPTGMRVNAGNSYDFLEGIKIRDLPFIVGLTGLKIHIIKDDKDPKKITCKLELPKWDFTYYHSFQDYVLFDFYMVAAAIKKDGHNSIVFNIDHKDPKKAMELARVAYEACRLAQFEGDRKDPKDDKKNLPNIQIIVNGEEKSIGQLFNDSPQQNPGLKNQQNMQKRLETIEKNAGRFKQMSEDYINKNNGPAQQDALKKELARMRADNNQAATPAPSVGSSKP